MRNQDLLFYHIYPLGFCGSEVNNYGNEHIEHRLLKVINHIPSLKALGVNAIYIGPLFKSETHGYDTIDYYQVDNRLGSHEDLKMLVEACHKEGIIVILDCVFNHVSRQFFAFRDLMEKGIESPYLSWFKGIDFNSNNPFNDGFNYETWDGHYNLVKFNLTSPDVKEYLIGVARSWIDTYAIDGLRLDAADVMDLDFLRDLTITCKELKNDFFMLGEIVKGDYLALIQKGELDSVTNYECYKGLYSSLNDANYFEIAYSMNRQFGKHGIFKDKEILYNFADNHDVNRIASTLTKEAHIYPLYILLYTMPGIPSIYYLSEYGQKGIKVDGSDQQLRTALEETYSEHPLYRTLCKLGAIRSETKGLKYGDYLQILVASEQFAFLRSFEEEQIIILLNSSSEILTLNLPNQFFGTFKDLLNDEVIHVTGPVIVYPNWGRILKRV